MAKKKEPTNGEIMAKEIIAKYKPKTVEDMQNALKDIFGPMFETMLNGEMDTAARFVRLCTRQMR